MTALFISHSVNDNPIAAKLGRRMIEQGYQSLFLDSDPAKGIPAGRDWQRRQTNGQIHR